MAVYNNFIALVHLAMRRRPFHIAESACHRTFCQLSVISNSMQSLKLLRWKHIPIENIRITDEYCDTIDWYGADAHMDVILVILHHEPALRPTGGAAGHLGGPFGMYFSFVYFVGSARELLVILSG